MPSTAVAGQGSRSTEYFAGHCDFAARDAGPPQGALMPKSLSGTTSGSGTCTGTITDLSGTVGRLDRAPTTIFAELRGFGGCDAAHYSGPGTLRFPGGRRIDFLLTDSYIGPVATGRLVGTAGGDADLLFVFADQDPIGSGGACLNGTLTHADFRLLLNSNGIRGGS